jgi:hypothetical protein
LSLLATAQHLIWHAPEGHKSYTALYGEVTVLSTNKTIYFCGCNWWPGNPAGGYTGIQDAGNEKRMIFSIWDTTPELHPETISHDPRVLADRFGGEGTGAHTHLVYNWEVGHTYRWYAEKRQDASGQNTLATVYFFDETQKKWVPEATIKCPNGGKDSVATFGGMLNSFLENWSGQERAKPKLAIYKLWGGTGPNDLSEITASSGDGKWGVMNGGFFLAEGDDAALKPLFDQAKSMETGSKGHVLKVEPSRIEPRVLRELSRAVAH